jgi:signal transduction histidine kinase
MGEVYVSDTEGNVFICSCPEWEKEKSCIHSTGAVGLSVLEEASNGKYFEVGHLNGRFNRTYYTAATPFYSTDGELSGFVFISSPASLLRSVWEKISDIFIFCAALPLIALFIFLFFMTRKITQPINLMSKAAVSMSKGDFSNRVPVSGDDEIANLAEAFNAMSNSLTQLENMRRGFISNVSHELRTPMTTISGFVDGIIDGTIPYEKQGHYLEIVSSEIKRLSRVVQSMLSLARLESGEQEIKLSNFSVVDLVCEVLISQQQRIDSKSLNIQGLDMGTEIKINADRDLIYQAIFNLTDNAIKFSPDGGTIEFSVSRDNNRKVRFSIRNEGKGISPDQMQYVFDRFYKVDKARSQNTDGTGLGLYITKTIVDIHNGNITVSSQPDKYTEFEIIFDDNVKG